MGSDLYYEAKFARDEDGPRAMQAILDIEAIVNDAEDKKGQRVTAVITRYKKNLHWMHR